MRNWVDGPHFPDAARVEVRSTVSEEARANLTDEQVGFLSVLKDALPDCEWSAEAIGECIRRIVKEVGIDGRKSYVALYWVIISRSYGPTVAPLMAEMEKESLIGLLDAFDSQ